MIKNMFNVKKLLISIFLVFGCFILLGASTRTVTYDPTTGSILDYSTNGINSLALKQAQNVVSTNPISLTISGYLDGTASGSNSVSITLTPNTSSSNYIGAVVYNINATNPFSYVYTNIPFALISTKAGNTNFRVPFWTNTVTGTYTNNLSNANITNINGMYIMRLGTIPVNHYSNTTLLGQWVAGVGTAPAPYVISAFNFDMSVPAAIYNLPPTTNLIGGLLTIDNHLFVTNPVIKLSPTNRFPNPGISITVTGGNCFIFTTNANGFNTLGLRRGVQLEAVQPSGQQLMVWDVLNSTSAVAYGVTGTGAYGYPQSSATNETNFHLTFPPIEISDDTPGAFVNGSFIDNNGMFNASGGTDTGAYIIYEPTYATLIFMGMAPANYLGLGPASEKFWAISFMSTNAPKSSAASQYIFDISQYAPFMSMVILSNGMTHVGPQVQGTGAYRAGFTNIYGTNINWDETLTVMYDIIAQNNLRVNNKAYIKTNAATYLTIDNPFGTVGSAVDGYILITNTTGSRVRYYNNYWSDNVAEFAPEVIISNVTTGFFITKGIGSDGTGSHPVTDYSIFDTSPGDIITLYYYPNNNVLVVTNNWALISN